MPPRTTATLLTLAFAFACGDTTTSDTTDAATSDDSGETGAMNTVTWNMHAMDFISEANLAGTEACVRDAPDLDCATTDSEGMGALEVPKDTDVVVELTRDGYTSALLHIRLSEDFTGDWQLIPEDGTALLIMQAGGMIDTTKSHITMASTTDGLTASLEPESGLGPIYLSELNLPQASLDATTSSGYFGWANIDPGEVVMSWAHPTKTCTPLAGWESWAEGSMTVALEAGKISGTFSLQCE